MPIPRLQASADDLSLTITVNKNLRPYFTKWYQEKKIQGETPQLFAIRMLKQVAINDYIKDAGVKEAETVEQTQKAAIQELNDDAVLLQSEL